MRSRPQSGLARHTVPAWLSSRKVTEIPSAFGSRGDAPNTADATRIQDTKAFIDSTSDGGIYKTTLRERELL
jgi:hypothetical protein